MENILKNWKTSLAGLGALLAGVGHIATSVASGGDISHSDLVAIIAAVGLLAAKDGNVTGTDQVQQQGANVKRMLTAFALLPLLFVGGVAMAADLPPVTKAPPLPPGGLVSGTYVGVGTYLETTQAQFSVGATQVSANADTGSLGGVFGFISTVGGNWWGLEGGAYWQNLGNAGTVCSIGACLKSNFSGTGFFEVGIPPGINILPNVTSLFPGFNPGGAASNMYPYIGVGFHADDVSGSLGAMNGKDWIIPFATRAGVKTKLTNGSVWDMWGDITFKGSGFAIGPGVAVNQGNTYRVGTSFLFKAF